MNKFIYPAKVIINPDKSYTIDIIDLIRCTTEGDTLNEAIENARETIGLYLEDLDVKDYPKPTNLFQKIKIKNDEIIVLLDFDLDEYRRKYDNKAIKKTLTIPNWLNTKAEEKGVNFSYVLQKALKIELNLDI